MVVKDFIKIVNKQRVKSCSVHLMRKLPVLSGAEAARKGWHTSLRCTSFPLAQLLGQATRWHFPLWPSTGSGPCQPQRPPPADPRGRGGLGPISQTGERAGQGKGSPPQLTRSRRGVPLAETHAALPAGTGLWHCKDMLGSHGIPRHLCPWP